jgi:hypothetical protein
MYIFSGNKKKVIENGIQVTKNNGTTVITNSPDSTTIIDYTYTKSPNGSYTSTSTTTNINSTAIR